ncbi:MAG TPA: site-specific integrase [Candidatus Nitrosotalea sp.]|nr:site-specific integrase [Candidatus Nitrosotalea sp.]
MNDVVPEAAERYRSLPVLGSHVEDFIPWMSARGYRETTLYGMLIMLPRIDRWLREHGVERLAEIDPAILSQCWKAFVRRKGQPSAVVGALREFLAARGLVQPEQPKALTPSEQLAGAYGRHLETARGLCRDTIDNHARTVVRLLNHIGYDDDPARLKALSANDIEGFIRLRAPHLRRSSMQVMIGELRGFLRFVSTWFEAPAGLENRIDTPRIYTQEQLPRALPWDTVQALLESIDRSSPRRLRDYTMLFLAATYGLRVGEVVALTLDDINWRQGQLKIVQEKTRSQLVLPLTDQAGSVILDYLRKARPSGVDSRRLFISNRAPIQPLARSAVTAAFERHAKRSGLKIPFAGAHCLRHSYAVHLLRKGVSLKLIGDLLGHRSAGSTCVYLRLATEDLRQVPLPVPKEPSASNREVQP